MFDITSISMHLHLSYQLVFIEIHNFKCWKVVGSCQCRTMNLIKVHDYGIGRYTGLLLASSLKMVRQGFMRLELKFAAAEGTLP